MYYGASLLTSINPSFCSLVLPFLNFLRPEGQRRALQGCTETNNIVCQNFNEVGGAVGRELHLTRKSFELIAEKAFGYYLCNLLVFFSISSLISRIQSMSGTITPSGGIHRLNSKFAIYLSFDCQYNMKMW